MAFSSDQHAPVPRFRPGPGQSGQAAAQQALKPHGQSGGQRPKTQAQGQGAQQSGQQQLGFPRLPQKPGPEPNTDAHRHLLALLQHQNMQDLGRSSPFGIWALNTHLIPGVVPFDVLDENHGQAPQTAGAPSGGGGGNQPGQ